MKNKKFCYNIILVFFSIVVVLVLMTGCGEPIVSIFSADPSTIKEGESSILTWDVSNATTVTIEPEVGTVDSSGSTTVSPVVTTDYNLIATNSAGSVTATVIVTVINTITIQPDSIDGKDAIVDYTNPTINYGNVVFLVVSSNSEIYRSYLQFDLSDVPQNAVIVSADLGLCYVSSYILTSYFPVGLYEVTESWEEDTITWDNQPASSTEAEDIQDISTISTGDFVYWEIDDLVEGWHDGSIANYGVVLRDTDESSADGIIWFWSSEYGSDHPKLIIDYYIP